MPKLKLRNAYLRGWFAARSERGLPEVDELAEKIFIDLGFEAGTASGGRALPPLENPYARGGMPAELDIDALIEEIRARKEAQSAPPESAAEPPTLSAGDAAPAQTVEEQPVDNPATAGPDRDRRRFGH